MISGIVPLGWLLLRRTRREISQLLGGSVSEQEPQVPPAPQATNYSYNTYVSGQASGPPDAVAVRPKRPKQVESSFTLLLVTLALTVLSIPVGIMTLASDESKADLQNQYEAQGLVVDVDAAVSAGSVLLVALGVICFAVTLVTALFIRKGHQWARIVLTVYAALTIVSFFTASNLLGWWGIMTLLLATVPLYLKPVPAYFAEMKQYRQSKKASQLR